MKRIVSALLISVLLFSLPAFAAENKILIIRNQIFDESKELKAMLSSSQDVILVSSLWDSCLMTVSQLDAYFSMLAIVNTIKDPSADAIAYLESWLNDVRLSNDINIKSLNAVSATLEPKTRLKIILMRNYFADLNQQIGSELDKLSQLKKTLRPKKKR